MNDTHESPGSVGERRLQQLLGTAGQAGDFYDRQVQPRLTGQMAGFIARQTMMFLSTADAGGACDITFRAGPPGFVTVLDDRTLTYPEYRGNGVLASAGNITENPHVGLLFVDFTHDHIGLHVNGAARLRADEDQRRACPGLPVDGAPGRRPEFWVHITVQEAYVHCSKHIPHLEPAPRPRQRTGRPRDGEYFVAPDPLGTAGPGRVPPAPAPPVPYPGGARV
ncbi:hydrolase [Streptomyces sp. ICN441]|uniref:Hydrolase n=1 Tax=Streptomyces tirandamycinicus TaxID=2174846 RepID=A0A2S1SZ88_9ACTN|nr:MULTISPECIES: pyridoxamine 5'-phosphate oxidase family protein [Streptomyces]AWI31732.1 hydrolase [Streptomyces tirandamycinicus]NNJ04748.1 hydrolase [Streptomyces sp. PKU-MA01144]TFE53155.1 hydrolase [Streptomyces sp. ICN441]